MTNKKFVVKLSGEERGRLSELISKGKAKAKTILKARILLKADESEAGEGWADEEICRAGIGMPGEELADGFVAGIEIRKDAWGPMFDDRRADQIVMPILALCSQHSERGSRPTHG
jgi:hypothetical protein